MVPATPTGRGPVGRRAYGFSGPKSDLLWRGLSGAGSLTPAEAKVVLHTAPATGASVRGLRELFENGEPT